MDKRVYFVKDTSDNCIDAVIIATKSKKKDIEKAIRKVKKIECYTWDDLVAALPSDCEIYDRWNEEEVYY